jgi:hypothetical protein
MNRKVIRRAKPVEEVARETTPGLSGDYGGACVICLQGCDTAAVFQGPPEWPLFQLHAMGMPLEEALNLLILFGTPGGGAFHPVINDLGGGKLRLFMVESPEPVVWWPIKLCTACGGKAKPPVQVHHIPTGRIHEVEHLPMERPGPTWEQDWFNSPRELGGYLQGERWSLTPE